MAEPGLTGGGGRGGGGGGGGTGRHLPHKIHLRMHEFRAHATHAPMWQTVSVDIKSFL